MNLFKHFFKFLSYASLLTLPLFLISCGEEEAPNEPKVVTKNLVIDPLITYQTIAGFGGANQMWGTQFPSVSDMKSAFGADETDLGLSIFRIRIASNPNEWPLIVDVCKEALKHGAKIIASPWSPPADLKSNESDIGGFLPEENYQAYADHLNDFVEYMTLNDVDIYAISIQNEPDIQVSYESCDWTGATIRDFIKNYGDQITGTELTAPESFNFNQSFTSTILNDSEAFAKLDIVAGHIYGSGLAPFSNTGSKEVWMTEYLLNQGATSQWNTLSESVIWDESLQMMNTVHQSMKLNWNAYIWWYLKRYYSFIGDGTQGTNNGEILKRGYAFSHFSKFVRPGYVRIKTDFPASSALISAYQGNDEIVVVIVNPGTSSISNISLSIGDDVPLSATTYVTDLSMNRIKSQVQIEDDKLLVNLPAKSIMTVVIED